MGSIEQDIKRHGIEEAEYQKAHEEMQERINEDPAEWDGFMRKYYPKAYQDAPETTLAYWHRVMQRPGSGFMVKKEWDAYVILRATEEL
jgi:ABC-type nitrate/sulfonate/bicarbonate transport system substrate-binding protein